MSLDSLNDKSYWGGVEMLDRIRGFLKATRYEHGKLVSDQGGDIEIMHEVERLCKQAITSWYAEGQR
jgi:hypothetical protein